MDYLKSISHFERGSPLWLDGIAYQHCRNMFLLGYGNKMQDCTCEDCKRAKAMLEEAKVENKLHKKKFNWFGRR